MTTMFRSAIRYATRASLNQNVLQKETSFMPQLFKILSCQQISLSAPRWEDEKKKRSRKGKAASDPKSNRVVAPEVQDAAVKAAKSLPGDWTKTAEELLARLQTKTTAGTETATPDVAKTGARTLLSTMKVGRSFEVTDPTARRKNIRRRDQKQRIDDDVHPLSIVQKAGEMKAIPRERRRTPMFKDLFGLPRLGIFEAKKKTAVDPEQSVADAETDLWAQVEKEHVRKLQAGLPRNAFEEMIRLTEQGKVWTFPVDNEADLHEECKYKFHDHVFLERHLTEFPATGPIRKFMELVTLGLSQNPHVTVPEKLEHIAWFAQYFREKQEVLEASLGEEGKMRQLKGGNGNSKGIK